MNSHNAVGPTLLAAGGLILAGLAAILFGGSDLGFYIAMQLGFAGVIGVFLLGLASALSGLFVTATGNHPKGHAPRPTGLRSAHCH